jgi:uncharacterized protein involved in exopolysaccharide biosynthesis
MISPRDVLHLLKVHSWRWLVPTFVVAALATGYALMRPPTWEASQALIVRDEAANNQQGPGKFRHTDEMKTVQETILELARSRGVLVAAMKMVGPPADYQKGPAAWPTARDVTRLRERIELTPPKGAEFGKTEIFYLQTRDHDRARAVALSKAICDQLLMRFQEIRDQRARSMTEELAKAVLLTKSDLETSTRRLSALEREVGSDLAELRMLAESTTGDSPLQQTITQIRSELRETRAAHTSIQQLLTLLQQAQEDPGRLVAAPSRLLESQPALRRLKEGLIDAEIRSAELRGSMSKAHPLVMAAQEAEEEIGQHLHSELEIAIRGLAAESEFHAKRVAMLDARLAHAMERLGRLAGLRAEYLNLVSENRTCASLVDRAEHNLAEARVAQAGAKASSLIARIDLPDTGNNPVGPSRALIVLLGIAGGLLVGFGIVFLTVQPQSQAQTVEAAASVEEAAVASLLASQVKPYPADSPVSLSPQPSVTWALGRIAAAEGETVAGQGL